MPETSLITTAAGIATVVKGIAALPTAAVAVKQLIRKSPPGEWTRAVESVSSLSSLSAQYESLISTVEELRTAEGYLSDYRTCYATLISGDASPAEKADALKPLLYFAHSAASRAISSVEGRTPECVELYPVFRAHKRVRQSVNACAVRLTDGSSNASKELTELANSVLDLHHEVSVAKGTTERALRKVDDAVADLLEQFGLSAVLRMRRGAP